MNRKIKPVSGNLGSPLENFGLANFIQVYINDKPYFRYDDKKHGKLLESLLMEFNIKFETIEKNVSAFYSIQIPKPEGKNYSLVGEGQINEAYFLTKKDVHEIKGKEYYSIFPGESDYCLFPSISHLNKILNYFDKPVIFASQGYQTEEQRGFLNWDPEEQETDIKEVTFGGEAF